MKACDYIVDYLYRNADMEHVFTYAGGTNAMLLNSMALHSNIRVIPMKHEENAALAADGYARAKRKIGFALAMSGPGATNMVTGIAQSYFDSSPVFYITGNVTTSTYKYDLPIRQLGFQETDIISIVRPITKAVYFADQIGTLPKKLKMAIRDCISDRTGPVLLDIPFDIQKLDVNKIEENIEDVAPHYNLSEIEYKKLKRLFEEAKKPLILAGGGIQSSNTADALAAFARRYRIPVVTSLLGKDAFPNNDSLYVGFIGSYGNRSANHVLAEADLVIGLGTRFSFRQTAEINSFKSNKKVVHIDIDRSMFGQTFHPDLAVNISLNDFFADFEKKSRIDPVSWNIPLGWLDTIGQLKQLLPDDFQNDTGKLNPKDFLRKLSLSQSVETIYTVDVGGHQMWSAQSCVLKHGDRILYSGGLGTMGYAIPAAIGSHFARPTHNIVAICGDGGFQMAMPELQTIKHSELPIKIVVFNNHMLGLMKNFQDENFDGLHTATIDGYSVPDLCRIADAFGIKNKRLSRVDEEEDVIGWFNEEKGPLLLEIETSREWAPYPKVLPGASLKKQYPPIPDDVAKKVDEVLNG